MIALRLVLWMTVLTGIIYPLLITGIAQLTMKERADGDLVYYHENLVGARLIAQPFTQEKHFWPRPSASDYQTLPSRSSNLGPTSEELQKSVNLRKRTLTAAASASEEIPNELLFTSASGLDPHLSLQAARFQIPRISAARGWSEAEGRKTLTELIDKISDGKEYVNVLILNLALESSHPGGADGS